MKRKTAFVGHRAYLRDGVEERIKTAVKKRIAEGCTIFTMGTHGEFDKAALHVCRKLRKEYPEIEIEVVLTDLSILGKKKEDHYSPYEDVNTIIYDIETYHYKRRIAESNKLMIDTCDTLICYVDEQKFRSGAKSVLRYAEKKGLTIINLYEES